MLKKQTTPPWVTWQVWLREWPKEVPADGRGKASVTSDKGSGWIGALFSQPGCWGSLSMEPCLQALHAQTGLGISLRGSSLRLVWLYHIKVYDSMILRGEKPFFSECLQCTGHMVWHLKFTACLCWKLLRNSCSAFRFHPAHFANNIHMQAVHCCTQGLGFVYIQHK